MNQRSLAAALGWAVLSAGCATHFENHPLLSGGSNPERRVVDVRHKDRPVILVAVSGGGSRAADLGWVVLRELKQFQYVMDGETRSLIDDVAMVSSVSGGSVIAAHFGLSGPEGLDRFEPDFLAQDNMRTLERDAANPITWIRIAVTGASRIETEEELFDKQLFHGKTFAQLNQPGKPFIVLNATDMAGGEVFAFTASRFDDICSDFDQEPIAVGVAASAAFPILMSPVAFRNYSVDHCRDRPLPGWVSQKLSGAIGPYLNIEEYKSARYANDLRRGPERFRDIDYVYLLDGGLADNLGVHSLLEAVSSPHGLGGFLAHLNDGDIRKIVVISINARSDAPQSVYQSPERPGVLKMIGSVTSVPIDAATASVDSQLDLLLAQLKEAGGSAPPDAKFGGLRVYGVQIDFDQLRGYEPEQRALRERAKAVPTAWTISAEDRAVIKQVGVLLLHQHPCFQRLVLDMGIPAPWTDDQFARAGCPQPGD
jgi:NTE family protein